jgi:2-polyprenyl-3-methyl-5-hydroxy-6-metoxy-1,4-benzoquinol methylase
MKIPDGAYPYIEKRQPWSSHWYIRRWLSECNPGIKVLDIGTASGIIGQALSDSGFFLTGLEPEPRWAEIARPFYQKFWQGTIEEAPPDILAGQDIVILADVLEHLSNPESVLKHLYDLQPAGCIFIISVPNIANLSVRLNLLLGRFDYQERGILDKTHRRLFTRNTLYQLLLSCGLEILESSPTPVPLALVDPFFENSSIGKPLYTGLHFFTRLFPTVLGYQFIVKARKPQGI